MIIPINDLRGELERQEKYYISLLEKDKIFEELIIKARKKCNIMCPFPENYPSEAILEKANRHSRKIINIYGLPDSWINSLNDLIVLGKFSKPINIGLSGLSFRYNPQRKGKQIASPLRITIYQKIGMRTFENWLKDNKATIAKHLKELPRKNVNPSGDMKMRLEIFELYSKDLKPKAIFNTLCKKYQKQSRRIPDYKQISDILYDLKRTLLNNPR